MNEVEFLQAAVSKNLITPEQGQECLKAQSSMAQTGVEAKLWEVLVLKRFASQAQVNSVLMGSDGHPQGYPFGPFRIESKLGEGGMGVVYLARREEDSQVVALKILPDRFSKDEKSVKRFDREAAIAIQLSHPNVVKGFEAGRVKNRYYFAMEYVKGKVLSKVIEERKQIDEKGALRIVMQIVQALGAIHRHGVVHRDVKPENIIMAEDGLAKLMDLGLAKSNAEEMTQLTVSGFALGTPHYMAPEQIQGEDLDARTDQYSLGATLYHMVTGVRPFAGTSIMEILRHQLGNDLQSPKELKPDLSDSICHVIEKMMAYEPEDRYATPAELNEDVVGAWEGKPPKSERAAIGTSMVRRQGVAGAVRAPARKPRTKRRDATPSPAPSEEAKKKPVALYAGIGAGLFLLLVIIVAIATRRPPLQAPVAKAPAEPELPPPSAPPERRDGPSPAKEASAQKALDDARNSARSGTPDFARIMQLYNDAAFAAEGTSLEMTAKKERDSLLRRQAEILSTEFRTLVEENRGQLSREEYGAVLDILASARKRYDSFDWTSLVDAKARELKDKVDKLYDQLFEKATAAQAAGKSDEVNQHTAQVARWGGSFEREFKEALAKEAPKKPAAVEPKPTPVPVPGPPVAAKPVEAPREIKAIAAQSRDIGFVGQPGTAGFEEGGWTIKGSGGAGAWALKDEFHFLYAPLEGDGELVVRVAGFDAGPKDGKVGLMLRESLDPDSRFAAVVFRVHSAVIFQRRMAQGGNLKSSPPGKEIFSPPCWLKLARAGNRVMGFHSIDGETWSSDGTDEMVLPIKLWVGLAVTSQNKAELLSSRFDKVMLKTAQGLFAFEKGPAPEALQPPPPARPARRVAARGFDIGKVEGSGISRFSNNVWTVAGAKGDVFGKADAFHFVPIPLEGDGEIAARVISIESPDEWAKAGLMIRSGLEPGAVNACVLVTRSHGVSFQSRASAGDLSKNVRGPVIAAPCWVKLSRRGDTMGSYFSPDGASWTLVGSEVIKLPGDAQVGLAVCGRQGAEVCRATFDGVTVSGASGDVILLGAEIARVAEPSADALKKADKEIHELYKDEFGKRLPAEMMAMAAKFIKFARTAVDGPTRYVLLREAREAAARAGAEDLLFQAIKELTTSFETDFRTQASALERISMSPGESQVFAAACLKLCDLLVDAGDDYAGAQAVLLQAEGAARKVKDGSLVQQVQDRRRVVQDIQKEFTKAKPSFDLLKDRPDDPAANLAAGKFLCFSKGDWTKGMPHLVRGSDPKYRDVADRDLKGARAPEFQAAIGEAWWDLAEQSQGTIRSRLQERAASWYSRAWKDIQGIARDKTREKLKLALSLKPASSSLGLPANWALGSGTSSKFIHMDDRFAHSGRSSLRVAASQQGLSSVLSREQPAAAGAPYNFSAWVLSDRTQPGQVRALVYFHKPDATYEFDDRVLPLADQPFWTPLVFSVTPPPGTQGAYIKIEVAGQGEFWIDDISLKRVGEERELMQNGTFER